MINYSRSILLIALLFLEVACQKSSTVSPGVGGPGNTDTTITPAPSDILVSTLASSAANGAFNAGPHSIVADDKGNFFFSTDRGQILALNAFGLVSTFAGGINKGCEAGNGTGATFTSPFDI